MIGRFPTRTALSVWETIALFSICACANQGAPPGGPRDLTGPQVVETFPDTFAVVAAFDDEIRIVFDERISERGAQGTLDRAVTISPESGEIRVRHSSQALRVRMAGGFQPDQVYRVTVQPLVRDLFGNRMVAAFEFIFSTGAEMTPTVLAGLIVDRITEQPIEGARVTARVEPPQGKRNPTTKWSRLTSPSPIRAACTRSGMSRPADIPSPRSTDENRNREYDGFEPVAIGLEELNPADTVLLNFALLVPDTIPAMVQTVDVVDSLTLAVEFDDFLDPASELTGVSATLGPDSLRLPRWPRSCTSETTWADRM